jgi:hypothetical protein
VVRCGVVWGVFGCVCGWVGVVWFKVVATTPQGRRIRGPRWAQPLSKVGAAAPHQHISCPARRAALAAQITEALGRRDTCSDSVYLGFLIIDDN